MSASVNSTVYAIAMPNRQWRTVGSASPTGRINWIFITPLEAPAFAGILPYMPGKDSQRPSIFDLDALREAFMESVRENNVSPAEWGEHAERFIQRLAGHNLAEAAVSQITGAPDDSQPARNP
ncbi:hypothetical protein [Mesorhizobium sp. Cs1321R2N1]|uniref:hypothetical protein n=1 Tax=Mesorhizobium sp. Cs1321R2N1 TaxID=3015174 RepID=UPI00301B9D16